MIGALIFSLFSLVASIVGLAIPYWLYKDVGSNLSFGLWQGCVNDHCSSVEHISDDLKATQALELLGVISIAFALLLAILKRSVMRSQGKLPLVAGILAVCSGLFMIVGTIVFAAKVRKQIDPTSVMDYHAGFGLCISAGIMAIIAGIVHLLVERRADRYSQNGPRKEKQNPAKDGQ